jgi:hypothetical protein
MAHPLIVDIIFYGDASSMGKQIKPPMNSSVYVLGKFMPSRFMTSQSKQQNDPQTHRRITIPDLGLLGRVVHDNGAVCTPHDLQPIKIARMPGYFDGAC